MKTNKKYRKKSPNYQKRKSSPLRKLTNISGSSGIDVNFSYSRNLEHKINGDLQKSFDKGQ